jgi:hypothetical protein
VINLEVLRRRIGKLDEPVQADVIRYVDVLGGELDRLSHRLDVLLRLLRPSRGEDPAPINDLVEELWELVQLEAGRRSVTVEFVPLRGLDNGRVPREPTRQVILNLVLELLDALGAGERLEVRTYLENQEVRVSVAAVPRADSDAVRGFDANSHQKSRMRVARLLCQSIGGRVEVANPSSRPAFLLALPRGA